MPWRSILSQPQLWLLSAMYFCYAYSINIFLTWFPKYLHDARGFDIAVMGIMASLPLMAGVVGDLAGGWFSDHLVKRGMGLKMAPSPGCGRRFPDRRRDDPACRRHAGSR